MATPIDFGVLLGLAYQGFVDQLHAELARHGFRRLGSSVGYVVRTVDARPGLSQRDLAASLGVTPQAVGKIVDPMVRARLIARAADLRDRRAFRLTLGPRGVELLAVARAFHAAYERRLARKLGADVATARRVLEHVAATSGGPAAEGRLRAF
jgi:DNA-binding MarR family transcriptional regulator